MTQHTSRLCKGYLTKKESDGVLRQMSWPPQSTDLNQIEMVWDELARRVKENQLTSTQHMWELLQDNLELVELHYFILIQLIRKIDFVKQVIYFFSQKGRGQTS